MDGGDGAAVVGGGLRAIEQRVGAEDGRGVEEGGWQPGDQR